MVTTRDRLKGSKSDLKKSQLLDQVVTTRDLPVTMRTLQGSVPYCDRCIQVKPDLVHHMLRLLKMDHHCPWVKDCVALNNYKFFAFFVLSGFSYCIFMAFSMLKYVIQYLVRSQDSLNSLDRSKLHILFLYFVSGELEGARL